MSGSKEELKGLPEIYLSPSRSSGSSRFGALLPSDAEHSVWDDTDNEVWTALVPEVTATEAFQLRGDVSEEDSRGLGLGQREEIEGDSSVDSALNRNGFAVSRSQAASYPQREREGSREYDANGVSVSLDAGNRQNNNVTRRNDNRGQWKHQRGETPGADCPPVAGIGALSRVFRQPLELNTNPQSQKSELVFSPGGDEGFMVPGGVCAYYGTGSSSDTDDIEWNVGEGRAQTLGPARDVEGANNVSPGAQAYVSTRLVTPAGPDSMERNSPAGLSTPDAEIDLNFRTGSVLIKSKPKNSIRPPVVGQSEEQVQTTRKDLGSTDGEESEDDGQKRTTLMRDNLDHLPADIHLSSLGSQSENTDSVNTVLDMSRGEVQGCETDDTLDTPILSPSQLMEPTVLQLVNKPTFVVGGPLAPRVKYKAFQNTVRGRMQDVMASLELEPNPDARMYVDRDQFLSQPPLCPPPVSTVSEQEASLASMISVESTNHPESSDRVTSPSVLSVSSAASSKRLEWDSGADVGYTGNTPEQITSSLSTLERIALGSYASVLRTEPEGTTYVAERQKLPKKSSKGSNVKSTGNSGPSRRSNVDEVAVSLPSKTLRGQHPRDRLKVSSSEEDFDGRFSSPGNSPRRRPRRRPTTSSSRRFDLPIRSVVKTKKTFGRLHELLQELNSEGKASSLVELNQTSRPVPDCRRSNSQQSLSYAGDMSGKCSEAVSSVSVAAGSSTSVATAVCRNSKPQSSLAPGDASASHATNPTLLSPRINLESEDGRMIGNRKSRPADTLSPKSTVLRTQERLCISSSNEVSSKSRASSDAETLSDVKDTDGDSCPSSNLVSDEEPMNLKARKNSENAKNHENIAKRHLRSGNDRPGQSHWQRRNDDSSSSSSLQRSLLESQVSIQSSNNSLQALSVRLKEKIQALLDSGTMKKVQDYNKLQDYVAFIGMPSANEEECQLKQGVASVIMRMFGEMGADDTDASNTMNSETSEPVTPSSQSDSKAESMSVNTILSHDEIDIAPHIEITNEDGCSKVDSSASKEALSSDEGVRSVTPGGTVKIVPYRPPSATRTYFMAVSCNLEEGVVEGERGTTPEDETSLAVALTARQDDLRGQAEGRREVRDDDDSELSSPTAYQCDTRGKDYAMTSEQNNDNQEKSGLPVKDWEDDESESISAATALPREWSNALKSQLVASGLPGAVTSDESSPRREAHSFPWDRRSSWHMNDKDQKYEEATGWKYETTKSEGLYKDKLGTLHVAKQPPGYTDDRDSHQSESTSDHEPHRPCTNDSESQEDRRPYAHPWTSSGSESAYETIRERHRHVDEALASSFEFYSTSPRDARLLGYVSSEAEKGREGEDKGEVELEDRLETERMSELSPLKPLPPLHEEFPTQRQVKPKNQHHLLRQHRDAQGSRETGRFISSFSSHTEDNDLSSSQISFVKLQKHRYVRRIQHYIDSLEKLERAIVGQFGESIGSENSFQRYVTEGRSHTESDSNNKIQTRDILGQSETASSSIASSDISDDASRRKAHQPRWRRKGILSRSDAHAGSQDVPHLLTRRSDDGSIHGTAGPLLQSSLVSSPRVNLSHRSSDMASSRTSTLKQIEKEVRMLALAEEKSRHPARKSTKSKSSGGRNSRQYDMQRMHREEPRGEEDPSRSLVVSRRGTLDSDISSRYRLTDQLLSREGSRSKTERMQKTSDVDLVSEEEIPSRDMSDGQISRRGDGRETGDTKQVVKAGFTAYSTGSSYKRSNIADSPPSRDIPLSRTHSTQTLQRDFGQMFPSTDCIGSDRRYLGAQSVGIQTGTSLLRLDERDKKDAGDSSRSSTASSSASKRNKSASTRSSHAGKSRTIVVPVRKDLNSEKKEMSSGGRVSHDEQDRVMSVKLQQSRGSNIPSNESSNVQKKSEFEPHANKRPERDTDEGNRGEVSPVLEQDSQERNSHRSDQGVSYSSQPTSERQLDQVTSDRMKVNSSRPATTRSEEQDIVNLNIMYSVPNSGRSASSSRMTRSSVRQGFAKSGVSDRNSDDCLESADVLQNDTSHPDSGIAENGHNKTRTSESEFRQYEERTVAGHPEVRSSNSYDETYSEGHTVVTRRRDTVMQDGQSANHPERNTYEQVLVRSKVDNSVRGQGDLPIQHQVLNVGHNQMETGGMPLLRVPQNDKNIDSTWTDRSSEISSTYRNESELVRNAKNRVVQMYSNHLIPYRDRVVEGTTEVSYIDTSNDAVRAVELNSRRSTHSDKRYKEPVTFEVNVSDKENLHKTQPKSKIVYTPQGRSGVLIDRTKKNVTLQEALSKARPDYVRDAGERRALIRLKQEMRQVAQNHNHEVISQIPTNLQTPSTLQRFLYKPDIAPLFSYRDIREQNRRLYHLLPESNIHQNKTSRVAVDRTNRLMANLYSQKLRKKVLKGLVSHAHKDIVTPTSIHRK